MLSLDLTGKSSGRIWTRKPNPTANDGIMSVIDHSGVGVKSGKRHRFLKAVFVAGEEKIIAGDHLGLIYLFDVVNNRYSTIQNTGQACTCIATGLQTHTEYLVALADTSLKCCSTETKELISWMRGHETAVHTISVNDSGTMAITTSQDTAQLWDIDTFERKRKLNVLTSVGIRKVLFIPSTNLIVTCFKDNSIFAWDGDTLEWKYQLKCNNQADPITYKAYAVAGNGKTLVAAGNSNLLHVHSLETLKITRIVQMPTNVKTVKSIHFVTDKFDHGANKVIGVLGQDGTVQFIVLETCRLAFEISAPAGDDKIASFAISSSGEHIVAVTVSGSLVLYHIPSLCPELHKPPGPLVKVVTDIWKQKASRTASQTMNETDLENTNTTKRSSKYPLNKSVTTGRIQYRSIQEEPLGEDSLPNGLSKKRLTKILRGYGEYPEQYRMFIWRSMLQLPENQSAFSALVKKGTHLAYASLQEKYPIKSGRLQRILQKILSALAHWSTIFAELDDLPRTVFPFVKLFQNNHLICFEMVATFLMNWCQHWFEFFPNPPLGVLSAIENVLAHHDRKLLQHFVRFKVTTQHYAWPLLQTLFTEVFTRAEWLRLFDHVVSNDPSFLLYAVVAYCTSCRATLIRTDSSDNIRYFFHSRVSMDLSRVVKETYHLMESTPEELRTQSIIQPFKPLAMGTTYPVFNKFPKFIVDYQARERDRIRKDEMEYLRETKVAEELAQEISTRKVQDEAWCIRQDMLLEAEDKRRKILLDEEEKLVNQRTRLAAMKRELRVRELKLLDAARMRFVQHQQLRKETEIRRLEEEIKRKAHLREQETAAAIEDVEVEGLELEAQRVNLEQQMAKKEADLEAQTADKVHDFRRHQTESGRAQNMLSLRRAEAELKRARLLEEKIAKKELERDSTKQQIKLVQGHVAEMRQRKHEDERDAYENARHRRQYAEVNQRLKGVLDMKDRELETARVQLAEQERELLSAKAERARLFGGEMEDRANVNHTTSFPSSGCLNSISSENDETESSTFTDRGRMTFEERERQLMEEVRDLRQRLVSQHSRREPPPSFRL